MLHSHGHFFTADLSADDGRRGATPHPLPTAPRGDGRVQLSGSLPAQSHVKRDLIDPVSQLDHR
jgi:hypothetical protein